MRETREILENAVVIGAHPDDELLWFNAVMKDAAHVIIVFREFWAQPGLGEARAKAIAELPHPNVTCLDIDEAGTHGCADWANPVINDVGIAFSLTAGVREVKRRIKQTVDMFTPARPVYASQSVADAYRQNYYLIRDALRPHLSADMNVFTHNPWGEYGHEDHIQVFRVLEHLRDEIGFTLWMSNYCTERALPLACRYFQAEPGGYVRLPTDKAYADKVAAVYRKHGCWTWDDNWAWFDEECFMQAPARGSKPKPHRHLMPLNMFTIGDEGNRSMLPLAAGLSLASAGIGMALADAI